MLYHGKKLQGQIIASFRHGKHTFFLIFLIDFLQSLYCQSVLWENHYRYMNAYTK